MRSLSNREIDAIKEIDKLLAQISVLEGEMDDEEDSTAVLLVNRGSVECILDAIMVLRREAIAGNLEKIQIARHIFLHQ